jgi:hypothetical protein
MISNKFNIDIKVSVIIKNIKSISTIFSILLGICLLWQWNSIHNSYAPNTKQLDTSLKVEKFLKKHEQIGKSLDPEVTRKSSIGMFIESLQFISANDIEVSGHVWQKIYTKDKKDIKPGIVFNDAIGDVTFDKRYTKEYDEFELYGWYFEANIRQSFQYSDYPLDHKTIWIKVQPIGFNINYILVPDLDSYEKTGKKDSFGISKDIILLGWELKESFFDYMETDYDTNFGLQDVKNHIKLPILAFNIVLNRDLVNAFMINITLILSTMFLLYILVLLITSDEKLKEEFAIGVGDTIGACGALFFTVLLAHIHLREQFTSAGFIYVEFFYLLNYFFIASSALIVFIFYNDNFSKKSMVFKNDALFFKLTYWPFYLGVSNIYTYLYFQ